MTRSQSALIFIAALLTGTVATDALAADVLVLSNSGAQAVADDFAANTSHTYTAWDSTVTPTQMDLDPYDVLLVFENGNFANAPNVGEALATYAAGGGDIVLGTFYWQDRSDAATGSENGWGSFETIDPFTSAAGACEYAPDDLDAASIIVHDMTAGVGSLFADSYRGGLTAKEDTVVLATWTGLNNNGEPDPVIGYRIEGDACIAGVSVFPDYASFGALGVNFDGDFYTLWDNVLESADNDCAFCGSGVVEPGEECDELEATKACDLDCTFAVCGDGTLNELAGETCDDGGESETCNADCTAAACGDGVLNEAAGETCDDGGVEPGDGCDATCLLEQDETSSSSGGSTGPDTESGSSTGMGSDTDTTGGVDTNSGSDTDSGSATGSGSDSDSDSASGSASDSASGATATATATATASGGDDGSGGADTDGDSGGGGASDSGGCSTDAGGRGVGPLALLGLLGFWRRRRG